MKSNHRGIWFVKAGALIATSAGLALGAPAASNESAQPVFQDPPAAAGPAPAAKSLKRELDAARARLADAETALAQQTAAKKKAMDDVVKLWQQVKADRENTDKLQRKLDEATRQAASARSLEKQLAEKSAALAELQSQLAAAQQNAERLSRTLAETQEQIRTQAKSSESAMKKQLESHQAVEVARTAAENRALTLAQEKAKAIARFQELEQALAAEKQRGDDARKQQQAEQAKADQALAQTLGRVKELETEIATARQQLQAQAGREASRTRAEARVKALEQENAAQAQTLQTQNAQHRQELTTLRGALAEKETAWAQGRQQADKLRTEIATLKEQAQREAKTAAAAQRQIRQELASLRQQAEGQTAALAAQKEAVRAQEKQLALKTRELEQVNAQNVQLRQAQKTLADEWAQEQAELAKTAREAKEQLRRQAAEQDRLREQMKEEELVRQGKALREQLAELDRAALASSLNDVGLLLQAEGQLDRAEEMFRRALAVVNQTDRRANAAAGTILQHLAEVAWSQDDLAAAASYYEEAAQQFSAALGSAHPRHAAALNGWARVRQDQHRPEEAEELYRMAIHIYERDADRKPGDLVAPLHNLGLLLMEEDRLDEAGPLLERAETLLHKDPAGDPARALIVARTLSRYYQTTGDVEQAAAYEVQANELALEALSK